jgi:predicted peroxiredoxin
MIPRVHMQKLFFLLLILWLFPLTGTVSAEEKKTIFYNITTEEAWSAGMALGQAEKALNNGYNVVIFLNVRGVWIASKDFHTDSWSASGKSLQDMLKSAMDKGATVLICPMCMKKAGMTLDDVIKGVVHRGPEIIFKSMTADDTVIISF